MNPPPISRRGLLTAGAATAGLAVVEAGTPARATTPGTAPTAASVPAGAGPAGELYLPEVDADTIAVLDTATNTFTRRIPVGPKATRPAVLAITPDGNKIYSDNFGVLPATISIIDRARNTTKTLQVASTPLGAFTSNDGTEIFLPELGFQIEVVSTETDQVVRRFRFADIPVGSIMGPDGLLYVGFATGFIGAYDAKTGAVVKKPIWSGGVATFWYTFTADGKKLYTDTVNSIGVIDLERWKLTRIIPTSGRNFWLPTDPGAFTSTLAPSGDKLYVTLFGGTDMLIVDVATDRITGRIKTEGATTGVTFSADGTRGYLSDLGSGTKWLPTPVGEAIAFFNLILVGALGPGRLIVFDPRTDQVLETLPTRPGPGISAWVPPISR
ncbi:YncE family protein [Flexivirga meconopsidis]|uniref:YncE family protein n=1 Tax=Flexivirga meconopsidis TaxID=2977121 RepID=UPI00223F88D6|nr:YncE family protein [Flexivirga meconopsidis]